MAETVAELLVRIKADTSELKSGLAEAESKVQGTGAKISDLVKAMVPAIGFALIAKGIKDLVMDVGDLGEAISNMSIKTGWSTTFVQELKYAAEQTGTNMGSIETAVKKMSTVLDDAFEGKKAAKGILEGLGLDVDEMRLKTVEERFLAVIESIKKIEDPTIRMAKAIEIFGRSGEDLIPLIEKFDDLKKRAHELGIILGVEDVEAARLFKEKTNELNTAWQGLKDTFAVTIMPSLTPLIETLTQIIGLVRQISTLTNTLPPGTKTAPGGGYILPGTSNAPSTPITPAIPAGSPPSAYPIQQDWSKYSPFASGGIVSSPTLAMVGEGGPEAIVPLDKMGGDIIKLYIDGEQVTNVIEKRLNNRLNLQEISKY